jgi:hypothetical protein
VSLQQSPLPTAPDYAQDYYWLSKPDQIEHAVDVFYVHPTVYTQPDPTNLDLADPELRSYAQGLLVAQAGVYTDSANLFAPSYRQQSAALQDDFTARGGTDMFIDASFQVSAGDVEDAFSYYLENLNQGRPFILSGHSQGTMTLIDLMRNRFGDSVLQNQLVAAYLIGYSVTDKDIETYPWMKLAEGASDTGVIITYNTEGPGSVGSPVYLNGAVAINPLNWRTDGEAAGKDSHLGAVFFNDAKGKEIERIDTFCGAYVDTSKGVLVAFDMEDPKSPEIDLVNLGRYPAGVYHRYDYAFWFANLKENVATRVAAYLNQ